MTVNSKMEDSKRESQASKPLALLRSTMLYFKMLSSCLVLYGMGYFNISTSWIVFGCLGYFVYSRALQKRALIIDGLKTIGKNEKKVILESIAVRELPSWVYFPDVERAEWLNQILKRMWPFICDYAIKILKESVQSSVDNCLPSALKPFEFTKIDLGDTPPRIGGVKVYQNESIKRNEIVMDLDLIFYSDARIQVQCGNIVAGIKEFELRGTLRIVMKPLVPIVPFVGACTVCFLDNPDINFLLTDMGNIMSLPGLQQSLMGAVKDVVSTFMVIPNRIPVQLVNDLELKQIRFPLPQGVVRINIVSARDLKASDINIMGKNTSDPYCVVTIGAQSFTTKVCQRTLNPTWNEYFEAVVDSKDGQNLTIECWDKDQGNKDDPLGTCSISLETVYNRGFFDSVRTYFSPIIFSKWITLDGVKKGSIHAKLQWMDLSADTSAYQQNSSEYSQANQFEKEFGTNLSTAYLFVLVDMARNLNRIKSMAEPSAFVSVRVGRECKTTQIKPKTNDPVWENVMHFMIKNPLTDELSLTVKDSKTDCKLGERRIPLNSLVSQPEMILDRPYTLKDTGGNEVSTIFLRLELKVLVPVAEPRSFEHNDNHEEPLRNSETELKNRFNKQQVSPIDLHKTILSANNTSGSSEVHEHINSSSNDHSHEHTHEFLGSSQNASPLSLRPSNSCGQIEITAHYCEDSNRLGIIIHRCKDLPAVGKDGYSDPYVKLRLMFDNGVSCGDKKKTQIVKNDLDPFFDDERFDFSVDCRDISSLNLLIEVKNRVGIFQRSNNVHNILGQCKIPLTHQHIKFGLREWYWLTPRDNNVSPEV